MAKIKIEVGQTSYLDFYIVSLYLKIGAYAMPELTQYIASEAKRLLVKQAHEFVSYHSPDGVTSSWLRSVAGDIYVRMGIRFYLQEKARIKTFEVSNISILPDYQGQGILTYFLDEVEKIPLSIYVENVFIEENGQTRLQDFLVRKGYVKFGDNPSMEALGIRSYIKRS